MRLPLHSKKAWWKRCYCRNSCGHHCTNKTRSVAVATSYISLHKHTSRCDCVTHRSQRAWTESDMQTETLFLIPDTLMFSRRGIYGSLDAVWVTCQTAREREKRWRADKRVSPLWVIASPPLNAPAQKVRPDSYQAAEETPELFSWLTCAVIWFLVEGVNELWRWGRKRKERDWHLSDHGNVFTLQIPPYISQQLGRTHAGAHARTFSADGDFITGGETSLCCRADQGGGPVASLQLCFWSAFCGSLEIRTILILTSYCFKRKAMHRRVMGVIKHCIQSMRFPFYCLFSFSLPALN